jgi:hypothetical protein
LANRRKNIPWLSFFLFVFNCPFPGGLFSWLAQLPLFSIFSFLLLFIYLSTVPINRKPRELDPVVSILEEKIFSNLSQVHTAAFSLGSRKNWFIGYSLNEFFPGGAATRVPTYHKEKKIII